MMRFFIRFGLKLVYVPDCSAVPHVSSLCAGSVTLQSHTVSGSFTPDTGNVA